MSMVIMGVVCSWRDAVEMMKFYDEKGTDRWYYYCYGNPDEKVRERRRRVRG